MRWCWFKLGKQNRMRSNWKWFHVVGRTYLGLLLKPVVHAECAQSCPILCSPMDCNPPGSSVHGLFQARILYWVAVSFSEGSSRPRDWTLVSYTGRQVLYHWATWEAARGLWIASRPWPIRAPERLTGTQNRCSWTTWKEGALLEVPSSHYQPVTAISLRYCSWSFYDLI